MKKILLSLLGLLSAGTILSQDMISDHYFAGAFPVVSNRTGVVPIYVDPKDHWLVEKAATLLQQDIQRVTGLTPVIITDLSKAPRMPGLIIIGSMDQSPMIQRLARQKMIPPSLNGQWESYILKTIRQPIAGVDRALLIAGSDRRGTAYGIFELSRQIGVSPWYWWADVPAPHKNLLFFNGNHVFRSGPPAVKYRGFFINDEAPALSGWVHEKYGSFNHRFYEKVFELLLRLKANYLWPAMWSSAFNDDDPQNPVLASDYGIVMGTSHHEPMLRAQQEWKRYGKGPWNYQTNAAVLDSFWRTGIEHMDHHESIVTIGMRGDGDMPMQDSSNISLLEKIVTDQRAIIAEVTGKDPAATPQSWALYKEVQDYYDKGMRVPDDVTLLLCDDNWGNVRKLPRPSDPARNGGYGMYYHFDYVGGPRNYKWLNTNPIARVWEEMHLTREYGDDRIWIVNVGDIKPMEFPISFFLDYAWDPARWPADRLPEYTRRWAREQFGSPFADSIALILTRYTTYNGRRKPELLSPDTYSLFNYREAERVVADYNEQTAEARSIYRQLPPEYRAAYEQLVLYPVSACANLNDLYVTAGKNRWYASQGRSATNDLAQRVKDLFLEDSLLSYHYNAIMAGGKWMHMMDQTHIGYTSWQEPRHNHMPAVDSLDPSAHTGSSWGVAVEGSPAWWPGTDSTPARLPSFSPYRYQGRYLEIFNRSNTPFTYTIQPGAPWIRLAPHDPHIDKEQRIWLNIDWTKAPSGSQQAPVVITGPDGTKVTVTVSIANPAAPRPDRFNGFVETDGCVSIEAQHYAGAVGGKNIRWLTIPALGRTLSAVQASPVTAPAQTPGGNSPHLEYRIWLFDTGTISVRAYLSPILEFNRHPIRYAVSLDDETPQIIDCSTGNEARGTWDKMVSDNILIKTSQHHITRPGAHTLRYWMVDAAPVLQKIVVDAGGVRPSYLGPPESPYDNPGSRPDASGSPASRPAAPGLKDYYKDYFPIGVAVSTRDITGPDTTLILRQFNSLTPENAMKMGPIHPQENRYYWKDADAIVDFATAHGMRIRGHNLCWHEQTPAWLFKDASGDTVTKEVLLKRLKDHITAVVSRYKGRVYAWDVVNEAVADQDSDDTTKILRNSAWYRICGDEFIAKAFEYAHAADPSAQLFYNDYNTERPGKRERVYRLLRRLVNAGVPITGVGIQAHWSIYEPSPEDLRATIDRFSSLGLKVQITELDISVYPWEKNRRARRPGESDAYTPELEDRQAEQYRKVFSVFRDYKGTINGLTFWNVTDRHTWLDGYPVPGRKNYPLLFDTAGQPKKAYWEVVKF